MKEQHAPLSDATLSDDDKGSNNFNHEDTDFLANDLKKELYKLTKSQDLSEMLKSRLIDLTKDEPKIDYLLTINGIGCLAKGDFQIVKGRKKAGKTTFVTILITALIKGEFMGFKAIEEKSLILYIDTEQNRSNTAIMNQKVNILCGNDPKSNHPQLRGYNLRGDDPIMRRKLILEAIEESKPNLVVIDGIKDLLESGDINNATDSNSVVHLLMETTKKFNIPILTVLHENKGDTELRGHLGSEIGNKMSEEWQLVKLIDVFTVKQIENRNERSGAISFHYKLDDKALPTLFNCDNQLVVANSLVQKKINNFKTCLPQDTLKTFSALSKEYCTVSTVGKKTAEKDIRDYKAAGYLIHDIEAKLYRFNFDKLKK